jgi:transposase
VQLVLAGHSVKDVSESLGCSDQSLHLWVKRHQFDARERDDGLTSAEREELRQLRKRVKRLEQERDILKRRRLRRGNRELQIVYQAHRRPARTFLNVCATRSR